MTESSTIPLEEWQQRFRDGTLYEIRRDALRDDGNKLIERMAFWQEIPLVVPLVTSGLADRLDKISDRIEELA